MEYFYHGSTISGITEIKACSKLHNTNRKVLYLTDNIPYALYYIWDEKHNDYNGKHVTGWIKDGIAYYEEQFPEQLKTFYKRVSGYLYCVSRNSDIQTLEDREAMFYSIENSVVAKVLYIPDVYEELLKYEESGEFTILRYNKQSLKRQNELIDLIASAIVKSDYYQNDEIHAEFMKKYFTKAWEKAEMQR